MPENEILTREELRRAYSEFYNEPEEIIEAMVEQSIEEAYGGVKQYEKRLAQHALQQAQEADNGLDPSEVQELTIAYNAVASEVSPQYAAEAEQLKRLYMREHGLSYTEAQHRATQDLINEHGNEAIISLDDQLDRLIEAGYTDVERYKGRIKLLASMDDTDALTAYKRAVTEDYRAQKQRDSMPASEKEFMALLDPDDRAAIAGLKAADPDAWSKKPYERYWRLMNPGKTKPPTKQPPSQKELQLMEMIAEEQQRTERLRQKFLNNGGTETAWDALMEGA